MNAKVLVNETHTMKSGWAYVREYRELPNGIVVQKFNIGGSPRDQVDLKYTAYEPTDLSQHTHHAFTFLDVKGGKPYGDVRSRSPSEEEIAQRSGTQTRSEFVQAWYKRQHEAANKAIMEAFPEDFPEPKLPAGLTEGAHTLIRHWGLTA